VLQSIPLKGKFPSVVSVQPSSHNGDVIATGTEINSGVLIYDIRSSANSIEQFDRFCINSTQKLIFSLYTLKYPSSKQKHGILYGLSNFHLLKVITLQLLVVAPWVVLKSLTSVNLISNAYPLILFYT